MTCGQGREIARRVDQLVVETGGGFARGLAPQSLAARLVGGRGQSLGRFDMRRDKPGERHCIGQKELGKSAEAGFQPADKSMQRAGIDAGESLFETGKAGRRSWAADRLLELAGQSAE